MAERRGAYRVSVGTPGEKDHLGDPDVDGENIKMDLQDMGWMDLAQDSDWSPAVVNVVMEYLVP
jgi:hypothetical protein